jgi:hypothetical protein
MVAVKDFAAPHSQALAMVKRHFAPAHAVHALSVRFSSSKNELAGIALRLSQMPAAS